MRARTSVNERFQLIRRLGDVGVPGIEVLDGQACYILALKPKQKDTHLISGEVWIDKHFFSVRQIEGELEKSPSWWLKQVRIKSYLLILKEAGCKRRWRPAPMYELLAHIL